MQFEQWTGRGHRLHGWRNRLRRVLRCCLLASRAEGTFHDITQRKKAEEALRDERQLLDNILNSIPTPVFYKDVEGAYLEGEEVSPRTLNYELTLMSHAFNLAVKE